MALQKYDDYVRCYIALQHVCAKVVRPCVENIVQNWHKNQITSGKIVPCKTSPPCPSGIDINKVSCKTCAASVHLIKKLLPTGGYQPKWKNINLTNFYSDPIEVAKVFALEFVIDPAKWPRNFGEFDTAGLLKTLMRFPPCYNSNPANVAPIKQIISEVRNELAHPHVETQISEQDRNGIFQKLKKLVDLLHKMHPTIVTTPTDFKDEINQIKTIKVTEEMKTKVKPVEESLKNLEQALLTVTADVKEIRKGQADLKKGHSEIQKMQKEGQTKLEEGQSEIQRSQKEGQTKLEAGQSEIRKSQKEGQTKLEEGQSEIERSQKEGQTKLVEGQSEIQRSQNEGQTKLEAGQSEIQRSQKEGQTKLEEGQSEIQRSQNEGQTKLEAGQSEIQRSQKEGQTKLEEGQSEIQRSQKEGQTKLEEGQSEIQRSQNEGQTKLEAGQSEIRKSQKEGQTKLEEGQSEIERSQKEGQTKLEEGQSEIQRGQKEGQTKLEEGQSEIQRSQKEGQAKLKDEIQRSQMESQTQLQEVKARLEEVNQKMEESQAQMKQDKDAKYIEAVAEELRTHYLTKMCVKQLYPWKSKQYIDLEKIYVQLTMDLVIPGTEPTKPIKQRLESYQKIFSTDEDRRRFVLEGRPGLGKTTLCAKIAYDWARRKATENSPMEHIELLFILRLGLIDHNTTIEEAILQQLLPKNFCNPKLLREIIVNLGKSVVIVLDALDEADPGLFNHHDFGSIVQIMTVADLPSCRVLVTTRPWRIEEITKLPEYRRLELQPFNKSDILEYVKQFFGQSDDDLSSILLGEELVEYIEENKLVVDASIPLITLLICWYWKVTEGGKEIPRRLGYLYDGIIDNMYQALSRDGKQCHIEKDLIVSALGFIAFQGLTPYKTQLVFSEDEVNRSCSGEIVSAACDTGLISRKGDQSNSVTFFHKSGQEKLAGEYLANHPEEMESYLKDVNTVKDALNIGLVLIASAAANIKTAENVVKRLMQLFESEIQSKISQYYELKLSLDDTRKIQQFIELCLECNYEADAKTAFNSMLRKLFVDDQVYFFGIQTYPAVALGYYITHCESTIRSLTMLPIAHPSDPQIFYGPCKKIHTDALKSMKRLPNDTICKITDEYKAKHADILHEEIQRLAPAELAAYIQCIQACEGLPSATETNIKPIIDSFEHIKLEKLSIDNIKLNDEDFEQLEESIANGHMESLTALYAPSVTSREEQTTSLAKLFDKMPALNDLSLQHNKIEAGKTLPILAEKLASCKLRRFSLTSLEAPAEDMKVLAEQLPNFSSQLIKLYLQDNCMNDDVATNLADNLPKTLTVLGISICNLSKVVHRELLQALHHLVNLEKLRLYYTEHPSDLVECVGTGLSKSWRHMQEFTLTAESKTLPQVTDDAWREMQVSLEMPSSKLVGIRIYDIRLGAEHLKALVRTGKQKKYKHVRLSRDCLPADTPIPRKHDFLILE